MKTAILVLDVGLTNCKASLFDEAGRLAALESQAYPTVTPQPGWSEQEPQAWMAALGAATRALLASAADGTDVAAIGVTAHMHGLCAVDSDMQAVIPCWTLFDRRAVGEVEAIRRALSLERSYRITGGRLEAYTPAAKIAWLKRNAPELFERVALFLSPKDMLRVLLGGEPVTDPIDAAGTLLYDLSALDWSDEILRAVGVLRDKLPAICLSTAAAGRLSDEAAVWLGLRAGIPLIVGAGDDIETLGAGLTEPGRTLEHIGTTGTLTTCLRTLVYDAECGVEVYPQALADRYLLGGATNAAGRSLEWARRWLAGDGSAAELPLVYPPEDGSIEPPLYLPYIQGERGLLWEAGASGAFFGLREAHAAVDMARAVYEGVAFSLKEILEANRRLGAPVTQVISGTADTNRAWTQLRADMYGFPISFPTTHYLTGLGTAMLALAHLGMFADLKQAAEACCHISHTVEPDAERAAHYAEKFAVYQAAVGTVKGMFRKA